MKPPSSLTYTEWSAYHAELFGLSDPKQLAAVKAWVGVFRTGGFLADELRAASDAILLEGAGFWTDHPAKILAWINRQRSIQVRDHDGDASQNAVCLHCGNVGRLIVPHAKCVVAEAWRPLDHGPGPTFYTMAVRCSCTKGRLANYTAAIPGSPSRRHSLPDLETYERKCFPTDPKRWQVLMAQRHRMLRELADACGPAPGSSLIDPVLEALRRRQRQPGEDAPE